VKIFKDPHFKRLSTHSLNYGLSDVLAQVIGFLLIPLYTRYLTPEDYGIVEITTTISAFVIPLMKLGLPGSVTRQYFEYSHDKNLLNDYITTIYKLLNWAAIIIGIITLILMYFTKSFFYSGVDFWPFIFLAIFSAGLSSNNQLQQKLIQNKEQSRYSFFLKISFTLISIILALIFVIKLKMGALGLVLSGVLVNAAYFVQALHYLKNYTTGNFNQSMAKEALNYGSGILPHHLAVASAPLINKTILLNMGSLSALGSYSVGMRFFLPLEITYTMINTAFVPIYNNLRKEKNDIGLRKNIRIILTFSFIVYTIVQLLGPPVMRFLLPISFHSAIPLLTILSIGFCGRTLYGICTAEIFFQQKTKFISFITITGMIVNVLICIAFVNQYQGQAICWASTISFIFWALLSYIYKKRVSEYTSFNLEFIIFILSCSLITFLSFFLYIF
jgi:O-antigen/teichoic acid export membrane protein